MTQQFPPQPPPYGQPDPRQWQGYGPPAPVKKKRKKWPWIVGAVVLLFVVIGMSGNKSTDPAVPAASGSAAAEKPAGTDGQPVEAGTTVTSDDLQITAEPVRK